MVPVVRYVVPRLPVHGLSTGALYIYSPYIYTLKFDNVVRRNFMPNGNVHWVFPKLGLLQGFMKLLTFGALLWCSR